MGNLKKIVIALVITVLIFILIYVGMGYTYNEYDTDLWTDIQRASQVLSSSWIALFVNGIYLTTISKN